MKKINKQELLKQEMEEKANVTLKPKVNEVSALLHQSRIEQEYSTN